MMLFTYCHIIYLSLSFNELYLDDVFYSNLTNLIFNSRQIINFLTIKSKDFFLVHIIIAS